FRLPGRRASHVAYLLEKPLPGEEGGGETAEESAAAPAAEAGAQPPRSQTRRSKAEGTTLVLRELSTGAERGYPDVVNYAFSENGRRVAYAAWSPDGTADGVYVVDVGDVGDGRAKPLLTGAAAYEQLALDAAGEQVAFITDRDEREADAP